jgi:hypothetical protein
MALEVIGRVTPILRGKDRSVFMLTWRSRPRFQGPLTTLIVHVDVYAAGTVSAGTARLKVGVTVWSPCPVEAAALKSLVAVGGPAPAGKAYGYATLFEAGVQVAPLSQVSVGALGTVTEFVASVLLPEVNWVDVAVTFQPAPLPVASCTSMANPAVVVWFSPFKVSENPMVPGTTMLRVPPLIVAVAAVEAEATDDVCGKATVAPTARADIVANRLNRILKDPLPATLRAQSSRSILSFRHERSLA